ncbi:hypothetical protein [Umboniibacter marinipuniceus]|uniref:hypothetical protein n=1 Tax=Umboniibacter marinipuniceus TaxID=569599 RepID=UPI000EF90707|nr:hypothetical protein [Umboniibacter marinipuniceus]
MRTVLVAWLCVVLAILSPATLAWAPNMASQHTMMKSDSAAMPSQNSVQMLHSEDSPSHPAHHGEYPRSSSANHDCCATDVVGSPLMSINCFIDCSALGFGLLVMSSQPLLQFNQVLAITHTPVPIASLPTEHLRPPIQ